MKLLISLELAQALVNYLQGRPYAEVHQLITALLQAERTGEIEQEEKAE
jgi:hypothetical protein